MININHRLFYKNFNYLSKQIAILSSNQFCSNNLNICISTTAFVFNSAIALTSC